ncbi:MAG: hypothetical protein FWD97_03570 [Defluviitaleaceae bacterium]|nr:hypothetical protein [Defluviitaleaceae bacterium]
MTDKDFLEKCRNVDFSADSTEYEKRLADLKSKAEAKNSCKPEITIIKSEQVYIITDNTKKKGKPASIISTIVGFATIAAALFFAVPIILQNMQDRYEQEVQIAGQGYGSQYTRYPMGSAGFADWVADFNTSWVVVDNAHSTISRSHFDNLETPIQLFVIPDPPLPNHESIYFLHASLDICPIMFPDNPQAGHKMTIFYGNEPTRIDFPSNRNAPILQLVLEYNPSHEGDEHVAWITNDLSLTFTADNITYTFYALRTWDMENLIAEPTITRDELIQVANSVHGGDLTVREVSFQVAEFVSPQILVPSFPSIPYGVFHNLDEALLHFIHPFVSLPTYMPAGFEFAEATVNPSLNNINFPPQRILSGMTISYRDGTDELLLTIHALYNPPTARDRFLINGNPAYFSSEGNGWLMMQHGSPNHAYAIHYTIASPTRSLTREQLIQIAESIPPQLSSSLRFDGSWGARFEMAVNHRERRLANGFIVSADSIDSGWRNRTYNLTAEQLSSIRIINSVDAGTVTLVISQDGALDGSEFVVFLSDSVAEFYPLLGNLEPGYIRFSLQYDNVRNVSTQITWGD